MRVGIYPDEKESGQVLEFGAWGLGFICYLEFVIWSLEFFSTNRIMIRKDKLGFIKRQNI